MINLILFIKFVSVKLAFYSGIKISVLCISAFANRIYLFLIGKKLKEKENQF